MTPARIARLKSCLDRLAEDYGPSFLDSDPVGIVHGYTGDTDREVAALVASSLAYGGASQIRASVRAALEPAGDSPARFAWSLTPETAVGIFRTFKHRWTGGGDLAFLLWTAGRIIDVYGSIGALVSSLDDPAEATIEGVMTRFSEHLLSRYDKQFSEGGARNGISYLVPSPAGGSACKRLAMFFRWMVRGPDGVDFGLWRFIDPARLVVPVDRHIARMGALLGMTARRSADWRMALDITACLRRLDPRDPVRYDFALVRPGILGQCTSGGRGDCSSCNLRTVCGEAT